MESLLGVSGGVMVNLTGGSGPTANIHVILVVKFYANSFAIPS